MRNSIVLAAAAAASAAVAPGVAHAAPGLGGEVYAAEVEAGELEFEAIYGELDGGEEDGESVLKLEAAYGVSDRLKLALTGEIEKEPGETREFEAVGFEAIYELGQLGGITFGLYGEYEVVFEGSDKVEGKLLMQREEGPLDLRFNLIAEKELAGDEVVELEYAASADVEAIGELRLGLMAFGELGTFKDFLPHAEHFVGPVAKIEIEGLGPELEIEAGYLFAFGEARDEGTDGQFRLMLEVEF